MILNENDTVSYSISVFGIVSSTGTNSHEIL